MEERILFTGELNLSQSNLPPGDYSDARNIIISEGPQGDAGAVKKLSSVSQYADLTGYQPNALAAEIDDDGNQYILMSGSGTVQLQEIRLSGFGQGNSWNVGDVATQTNGASGVVYRKTSSRIYVRRTSSTAFNDNLVVTRNGGQNFSVNDVNSAGLLNDPHSILKVDTSGNISLVLDYETPSTPTITDPTMKLLGNILIWNYFGAGVPLSWNIEDSYDLIDTNLEIVDLLFIKRPPYTITVSENQPETSAEANNFFDDNTITFAARYVFETGEVSVLSSFKTVIATPDRSNTDQPIRGLESVDITVPTTLTSHPNRAKSIQFYARVGNGQFRRIETVDIAAVGSSVTVNFQGQLSESLTTEEGEKNFDTVPVVAEAIEVIKNRVFFGNIQDDLDNETAEFSISIVNNDLSDFNDQSLPNTIDKPYHYVRGNDNVILDEITPNPITENFYADRNSLTNDSTYNFAIALYDEYFRTRGVVKNSIVSFNTGLFALPTRVRQFTVTGSSIPSWAKYYQIVATRNLSKDFSIEGYANSVFYELEDEDGTLFFSSFAPNGVKINSIVIDPPFSYTFQDGDKVNISFNGSIEQLDVKSVINGRIYCDAPQGVGDTYIGAGSRYFEIFSPKDITEEDSTLFYETGIIGLTSSLPETFTDPQYFDQTYLKEIFDDAVSTGTLDNPDTLYHFDGDSDPTEQEAFPIIGNGALLYMRNTLTNQIAPETFSSTFNFDGIETNDHSDLIYGMRQVNDANHGRSDGEFAQIDGLAGEYEKVVSVIDNDNYIAYIATLEMDVTDSLTDIAVGDIITINNSLGTITALVMGKNAGLTAVQVGGLTYEEYTRPTSTFTSMAGPDWTRDINSVVEYTVPGLPAAFERTFYSNDKMYIGNWQSNYYSADYPWNMTEAEASNPLIRFDNTSAIVFPAGSGRGRIYYDINIEMQSGQPGIDMDVILLAPQGESDITLRNNIDPGETFRLTGVIDIELNSSYPKSYGLWIDADGGSANYNIFKGSYIYGVLLDDISDVTTVRKNTEKYGLARKPNRRRDNDFTFDLLQGKESITDVGIDASRFETKIRFGKRFIDDAFINPISSFDSSSTDFVPEESGPITQLVRTNKLDSIGTVLLAVCERETNSIYVGERLVTNNDGSTSLVASDGVIGSIQPLQGSHGSKHRKSIAKDQLGSVVFWDDYNRDIIRYSREGLVPISNNKVRPFFQDKSGEFITFYDKFHDTYFFHHVSGGETISYNQSLRWRGFHDMEFDLGGNQFNDRSFPIKDGIIYQSLGSDYGSYFGSSATSYIQLSKFDQQNFEPRFLRMRGDLLDLGSYSVDPISIEFTNDNGQLSTLNENFFSIDGSYIYSDIYNDENNGGIREGIPLLGSNLDIKITLGSDSSEDQPVKEVYLGFNILTY